MLRAAILRTLPKIKSRLLRIDPHRIEPVRNQVRLARQPRHPEAMVRISRRQRQIRRRRLRRIADRNVQLIRGNNPQLWIAILPPELVPDHRHIQRAGRFRCSLRLQNHSRGRKKKHHHNQDRDHRPRKLDLIASVDLGRFPLRIRRTLPVTNQNIKQQTGDKKKDRQSDRQHQHRQPEDRVSRSRRRIEDVRRRPCHSTAGEPRTSDTPPRA